MIFKSPDEIIIIVSAVKFFSHYMFTNSVLVN